MTENEKKARIAELRAELRELQATPRSEWHSGFEVLLRIDTHKYGKRVQIRTETPLGEEPPRADYLILIEEPGVRMDKAIFRIFRGHNIIEYKNPHDALNERVLRKICGYANFYIGTAEHKDDVPSDQVTLSIFRAGRPKKLFQALEAGGHLAPDTVRGIYHVEGIVDLPFQIVVTDELEGLEYAAYRTLTDHAVEADLEQVVRDGGSEIDYAIREHYRVFLDLVAKKNPKIVEKLRRDTAMEITWMDIFKDAIEEQVQKARQEARQEGRQEGRQEARQDTWAAAIQNIMESLGSSVEEAMDLLKIPQNQRAVYSGLVNRA